MWSEAFYASYLDSYLRKTYFSSFRSGRGVHPIQNSTKTFVKFEAYGETSTRVSQPKQKTNIPKKFQGHSTGRSSSRHLCHSIQRTLSGPWTKTATVPSFHGSIVHTSSNFTTPSIDFWSRRSSSYYFTSSRSVLLLTIGPIQLNYYRSLGKRCRKYRCLNWTTRQSASQRP